MEILGLLAKMYAKHLGTQTTKEVLRILMILIDVSQR